MHIQLIFSILLAVSLTLMLAQLSVKNKSAVHILFAVFSGSIAMMAARKVGTGESELITYLIGLGACATCNGYWLVSRVLFRGQQAVNSKHILFAASVAMLLISKQSLLFWQDHLFLSSTLVAAVSRAMGELVNLLSSTMLLLTFWEGCRGLGQTLGKQRVQRIVFLSTFGGAVLLCSVGGAMLQFTATGEFIHQSFIVASALSILLVSQWLISCQAVVVKQENTLSQLTKPEESGQKMCVATGLSTDSVLSETDAYLAKQIKDALFTDKLFLQANLKVGDVAKKVDSPEYKVSRILRGQFDAKNFNEYINNLRIKHAQTLLADPNNAHWPVLVVGLESGFASVGPFTRAFKSLVGTTPNEYRQQVKLTTDSDKNYPRQA